MARTPARDPLPARPTCRRKHGAFSWAPAQPRSDSERTSIRDGVRTRVTTLKGQALTLIDVNQLLKLSTVRPARWTA